MAWCDVVEPRTLRDCRIALGQSQAAFAAMLGVPPESYRTWDTGRRVTPPKMLARARALATHRDEVSTKEYCQSSSAQDHRPPEPKPDIALRVSRADGDE